MPHHELTVIVCTRNRSSQIAALLDDLSQQQGAVTWRLLVVDNGSEDDTARVIEQCAVAVPLRVLSEPVPGKSRALNRALAAIEDGWCVFTDDDVRVPRDWLAAYAAAFTRYPQARVFGGPIVPLLPAGSPGWLLESASAPAAFAAFSPFDRDQSLTPPRSPFGPNFAVMRDAIPGGGFREDLGPPSIDSPMCEDVEFIRRAVSASGPALFVASAGVTHVIRAELVSVPVQFDRAFNLGRSTVAAFGPRPGRAASTRSTAGTERAEAREFDLGFAMNRLYGTVIALERCGAAAEARQALLRIRAFDWAGGVDRTGPLVKRLLRQRPDLAVQGMA
jgi:hypothetical protein